MPWNPHLDMYPDLKAVIFTSKDDRSNALRRFWDEQDALFGVPRQAIDGRTIVLPQEAIELLHGIGFITTDVISSAELTSEERAVLRSQ